MVPLENLGSNPIVSGLLDSIRALNPESDFFEVNRAGITRTISELTSGEVQAQLSVHFEQRLKELGIH